MTFNSSAEHKFDLKMNFLNVLLWPVMLHELHVFIEHREMDGDLLFDWENREIMHEIKRTPFHILTDRVIYICGSVQSGKSCLMERVLSVSSDNISPRDLYPKGSDFEEKVDTYYNLKPSQIKTGYRATRLEHANTDGIVCFQHFYEIPSENLGLMDLLLNGSECNEPKLPDCIIIVCDPFDENCMEHLEYLYDKIVGKLEDTTVSSHIVVVASKLDLLKLEDYEAEEGIMYKIKEFSRIKDVNFVGWSHTDRRDSKHLVELKKQLANCLSLRKSPAPLIKEKKHLHFASKVGM